MVQDACYMKHFECGSMSTKFAAIGSSASVNSTVGHMYIVIDQIWRTDILEMALETEKRGARI